jgi:hypothetical protein
MAAVAVLPVANTGATALSAYPARTNLCDIPASYADDGEDLATNIAATRAFLHTTTASLFVAGVRRSIPAD